MKGRVSITLPFEAFLRIFNLGVQRLSKCRFNSFSGTLQAVRSAERVRVMLPGRV